jgi:hypothetical protein
MDSIMSSAMEKFLDFDGKILIDEEPHLNSFLEMKWVRKDLFAGERSSVFQGCADVFFYQRRISGKNFPNGHPVRHAINDDRHHDTRAFNAGFSVANIRVDGYSVEHGVSITVFSDGQQCAVVSVQRVVNAALGGTCVSL